METKRVEAITLKADTHGTFEALIATFDKVDKHGDVVRRGAFADTITAWRARGGKVPVVFSHRSEDITQHVGECVPDDLIETDRGFQVRGQFYLDEPIAQKVFAQLRRKALTEWSFGFLIAGETPPGWRTRAPGAGSRRARAHAQRRGRHRHHQRQAPGAGARPARRVSLAD